MSVVETCSKSAPCDLCALNNTQSPPGPKPSPSRRGNKPRPQPLKLKPIIPDKGDIVAVKRAHNTIAARKSRQKQIDYLERLEKEAEELRAECNHWKNWAKYIETQCNFRFPRWLAANEVPVEASPTQSPPRQAIAIQHAPMRLSPLETASKETTSQETTIWNTGAGDK
jgi:hypothetical protein